MRRIKNLWKLKRFCRFPSGAVRMNCLAGLICLAAFGILFLNFHATPAGAGLDALALGGSQLVATPAPIASSTAEGEAGGLSSLSLGELNKRIHSAIHGSKLALQLHVALLELGKHRMQNFPDYSATFIKQERVEGDDLQDVQTCQLKLRHHPFSVYMKWIEGGDVGQEVLYVDGVDNNRLLVKLGGRKGDILPRLKLDPNGSAALSKSRHPITEMGLLQLTELIVKYRKRDLALKEGVRWQLLGDQKVMDQDCHCFVIEYDSKTIEPVYRKSITYIDKEHSLPICVKNFGWPGEEANTDDPQGLDEATLIEFYGYKDLKFENRLADADFDKANPEYKLLKR
jgi:Protein of unknown function (DUF1571)